MSDHEHVTLELKCCACGRVMDTLMTGWFLAEVRPQSMWTRRPCASCERELAQESALRQLPADIRQQLRTLLDAGVDVDLSGRDV